MYWPLQWPPLDVSTWGCMKSLPVCTIFLPGGSSPRGWGVPGRKWHHNPHPLSVNRMTDTHFRKHYLPLRSIIKDYVDLYLLDASVSSSVSGLEATRLETRRQTLFPSVKKGSSAWRHLVTGLYNHGCSLGLAEVCVLSELTSIYVCCYLNFVKQKNINVE